jgi:hypothetical protein
VAVAVTIATKGALTKFAAGALGIGTKTAGATILGGALAGAAARSLIKGDSFGDNLIAVLPDVIGSTIGNMIGHGVARSGAGPALVAGGGLDRALAKLVPLPELDLSLPSFDFSSTALAAPGLGAGAASRPTPGAGGGQGAAADAVPAGGVSTGQAEQPRYSESAAVYNGVSLGLSRDSQLSAFLLGADKSGWSMFERLDIASQNYLSIAAGQPGSLSARVLAENTTNSWRLELVTSHLESSVLRHRVFADALAEDIGVLRAAVNANKATVAPALAQFDKEAILGLTLGPQIGADLALGSAAVGLAVKGYNAWQAGRGARSMARVARLGREGEAAVGIVGPKVRITVPGTSRSRVPDYIDRLVLKEVKNVAKLGYTKQIKDYLAIAQSRNVPFELWVRPSTQLSTPLSRAIARGDITRKFIPGTK